MSQTDLVKETGIDRSTLADMIVRMQNKDLLGRKRTEEDQRGNSVTLPAAGRRALKAALPAVLKSEAKILEALPARMRPEFIKALTIIAKAAVDALADDSDKPRRKRR